MFVAAALLAMSGYQADTQPPIADWFRKERFGMFIHWGPVTLRGVEIGWSRGDKVPAEEYDALYHRFNPTKFDADEWMRIAKQAGMRYIVPTAKHHDGFLLWPSKTDPYNIGNTPFKRDVMGEIAKAARKKGLTMATYFTVLDWHSPDYPLDRNGGAKPSPNMPRHMDLMKRQLTELIDGYGAKLVWFDGNWEAPYTREESVPLTRFLRKRWPNLVINDRVESKDLRPGDPRGDYGSPEQVVGSYDIDKPWETCMTLGDQWAYKPDDKYKTPAQVVEVLLRTVTGDGNLLLNVGPDSSGQIPAPQKEILRHVGNWLHAYGESVYGTRGGPYRNGPWGGTTRKGNSIYVHVLNWGSGAIQLPPLPARIRHVRILQPGTQVDVKNGSDALRLKLDKFKVIGPTTIKLDIDQDAWSLGTLEFRAKQATDRSLELSATSAVLHGTSVRLQGDNIGYWVSASDTVSWPVELLAGPVDVEIEYACDPSSAGSEVSVEVGSQSLPTKIQSTGDWYSYQRIPLGTVNLSSGQATVTVRPKSMPHGAVMNLRAVRLRPHRQ